MAIQRQRVTRKAFCLPVLLMIGATSCLLLIPFVGIQAQPHEKIAHPQSQKRSHLHHQESSSSWNHKHIRHVLQHLDLAFRRDYPHSNNEGWSPANTVVAPLPAFLDARRLSIASPPSRLRDGQWRFVDAPPSKSNTTTTSVSTTPNTGLDRRTLPNQQKTVVTRRSSNNNVNNPWQRLRDDFHFKGYGISFYKSLMAVRKTGIAFRLPLLNHWDWWDSNPALPSIGAMFCIYCFPFNLSVCLTSSMPIDVLKCWLAKSLLLLQAAVWQFLHHLASALWIIKSVLMYPIQQSWRPAPFQLDQRAANATAKSQEVTAKYQSSIQERLGTSFWYRWTPYAGFDSRVSVWHLYMPTLEVYSQLFTGSKDKLFGPWWKSHFASLGVDSAVSNAMFSGTGVLSLSGLRFKNKRKSKAKKKEERLVETLKVSTVSSPENTRTTTKATLSTILHEDRDTYEDDDEETNAALIKVMRGGNSTSTSVASNYTTPPTL